MISVLIPVYNQNVFELVQELTSQLKAGKIEGEILVYDDGSHRSYREANRKTAALDFVRYKEMDTNHGRVVIRKLLALAAQYPWLLFLDGDSKIVSADFLNMYIKAAFNNDVVTGGRRYEEGPPADAKKKLHWKYGSRRESVKGSREALHTNNFLICKEIFTSLHFPNELHGYGYEDTWMDIQLRNGGKRIAFINNPVLHDGLEDTKVFLEKTRQALHNLLELAREDKNAWSEHVRIYKFFCRLRQSGFTKVFLSIYQLFQSGIERNLYSSNPSLWSFDVYRLHELIRLSKHLEKQTGKT